jgi:hypothetical protein
MTNNNRNLPPVRVEWQRPEVRRIAAGSAEVGAGVVNDGPLAS